MYKEMGKERFPFSGGKMNFKERKKRIEADVEKLHSQRLLMGKFKLKVNYSLEQGLVEVNMSKTQKNQIETINIVF